MASRGRRPRNLTIYPLFNELVKCGYDFDQVAKQLKIAPNRMRNVFQRPELLMLWQIQAISYLINKTLGEVMNICTFSKPQNPTWLSEDFDPNKHIEHLKLQAKLLSIQKREV